MAKSDVAAMWSVLAAEGVPVVYRPVTPGEIASAEDALGCRLPAAYTQLVLEVGAPAVADDGECDDARSMCCAVLTPAEIVELTTDWRTSDIVADPDCFEDPESSLRVQAQLAQAVFFALDTDPNDAFVFLLNRTVDGQPLVASFAHDYLEELDWAGAPCADGPVWASLASLTAAVVERLRRR
jgi:hypothetical protein